MTVKDHLAAARARIAQGWCQGVPARSAQGAETDADADDAVSWCIYGALAKADCDVGGQHHEHSANIIRHAVQRHGTMFVSQWNDNPARTQADVLKLFDDAIASAHEQPD